MSRASFVIASATASWRFSVCLFGFSPKAFASVALSICMASVRVKCEMDFVFDPSLSFSFASFMYNCAVRGVQVQCSPTHSKKPPWPTSPSLVAATTGFDHVISTASDRVLYFLMRGVDASGEVVSAKAGGTISDGFASDIASPWWRLGFERPWAQRLRPRTAFTISLVSLISSASA